MHRVTQAAGRDELARLWEELTPRGLWTEAVHGAAQARLAQLETASV